MAAALEVFSLLTKEFFKFCSKEENAGVGVKHSKYTKPHPLKYLFLFRQCAIQILARYCPE